MGVRKIDYPSLVSVTLFSTLSKEALKASGIKGSLQIEKGFTTISGKSEILLKLHFCSYLPLLFPCTEILVMLNIQIIL